MNLLEDDNDDGNEELAHYYGGILPNMMKIPLSLVSKRVLYEMAVLLHKTISDCEWFGLVQDMGVEDNFTIDKIEYESKWGKKSPIFIALQTELQHHRSLGNIIKFLIEKKRLDVLRHIRNDVEALLNRLSNTVVKTTLPCETISACSNTMQENFASDTSTISINSLQSCADSSELKSLCNNAEINGEQKMKHAERQQNSNIFEQNPLPSAPVIHEMNDFNGISTTQNYTVSLTPRVPLSPYIFSVFIPHSEADTCIAQQLSLELWNKQIAVKTMADMEYLLVGNSSQVLKAILQEVDFIVYIVSENLLRELQPQNNLQNPELSSLHNYNLYQMVQNESRFINFRVRPVLTPEMERKLLVHDSIFYWSLRLWKEVPKLIDMLKKMKHKIQKH